MKLGIRTGGVVVALIMLAAAGLTYSASERIYQAGMSASQARGATLQTYRIAQSIKSLVYGYQLTINEYYSTVLEYSDYQKKSSQQKEAIDKEMAALEKLETGDATAVGDLKTALQEIEGLRLELESALAGPDKNWDLAREALYKLNVVSVRAVQPADRIARIAGESSETMGATWEGQQSQGLVVLRIVMPLLLLTAIFAAVAAFRHKPVIMAEDGPKAAG